MALLFGRHGTRSKAALAASLSAGIALVLVPYRLTVIPMYTSDYDLYTSINLTQRTAFDFPSLTAQAWNAIDQQHLVGGILYAAFLISVLPGFARSNGLARRKLFLMMLAWMLGNTAVLATTSYHPARYQFSFLIPITAISALGLRSRGIQRRPAALIQVLLESYVHHQRGQHRQLPHIDRTLDAVDVSDGIARQATADGYADSTVAGNFANTISLFNGMPSANDVLKNRDPSSGE